MNKLTVIFITGLLCCFLCSCAPELTLDQRRSAAFAAHPEWSEKVKQYIRSRRICEGMTPKQIELAWDMNLKCVHAGSVRMMYEGRNCVSAYAQALLRNKNYDQMNYGLLHGTYTFWFTDEGLEDWSWSEYCYYDY